MRVFLLAVLTLPVLVAPTSIRADQAAVESLVAAERAFSAMSVEKGMKEAFLAFLADNSVIFRPLPANGKQAWRARESPAATLVWEPQVVEVAAAGDLGFTFGPWERRPTAGSADTTVLFGHYLSVWQRQADGAWKVALDAGVSHAPLGHGLGSGHFEAGPEHAVRPRPKPADTREERLALMALDRALSRRAPGAGLARAFAARAADDVRYFRDGEPPLTGRDGAGTAVAKHGHAAAWRPADAFVSATGDLGYSHGIVESPGAVRRAAPDSTIYVHVWRRGADRRWQLAVVLENPIRRPGRK